MKKQVGLGIVKSYSYNVITSTNEKKEIEEFDVLVCGGGYGLGNIDELALLLPQYIENSRTLDPKYFIILGRYTFFKTPTHLS